MRELLGHVRHGMRVLARRPVFTTVLLLTLGLGIGATTAVFSALDTIVLRPLPYPRFDQLVTLWSTNRLKGVDQERLSPVDLHDFRAMEHVFQGLAAWWRPELNLTDDRGEPVRVEIIDVTDNFFSLLGVQPFLGRGFRRGEDRAGADPVLVIGHELWRERYGADSGIVGESITLDGLPFTVIGVAPPGFSFPDDTAIWKPLGWDLAVHSRAARFLEAVARLAPGASPERAQAEVSALAQRLESEHPETNDGWGVRIIPLQEELVGGFRTGLWLLFAATGVLLLITCANLANLLLIQTTAREQEVAVRTALGASPRQLRLQFAMESLVQALAGGVLGLIVAAVAVRWLVHAAPFAIPRLGQVGIDGRVLAFTLVVAVLTGILFGLAPALRVPQVGVSENLKGSERGHSGGRTGRRARRLLVVSEVFLATVLVASAGLLVRSFLQILAEDPGVDPRHVLTANLQLPMGKYGEWERVRQFYQQLIDRVEAHPAIIKAAVTNYLPLDPAWPMPLAIPERPASRPSEELTAQIRIVGPGYFEALRIPIEKGRPFHRRDDPRAPAAVVINRAAAERFWPNRDAVGRTISTPIRAMGPLGQSLMSTDRYEVVGIAANAKNNTLLQRAEPTVYFSYHQFPYRSMYLIVKGRDEPGRFAAVVRDEVSRLDPTLALAEVRAMNLILSDSVAERRFSTLLSSAFAGLALLIAAMGIYGVLSYDVARRRHEIGIRMALGAKSRDILLLIGREGLALTLTGLLLGLACSFIVTRFLTRFLYGYRADDWVTFAWVISIVVLGALWASWLPALRAGAVDPVSSMRHE